MQQVISYQLLVLPYQLQQFVVYLYIFRYLQRKLAAFQQKFNIAAACLANDFAYSAVGHN
jgi:hypothetical protein